MVNTGNVLIIGGTGFIGYHITQLLLAKGHHVTVMSRHPQQPESSQSRLNYISHDIDLFTSEELNNLLIGIDAIVFAAGADDRTLAKRPAYDFFYMKNVDPVKKLGEAIKGTGVKNLIILGSYFSWLNRIKPELNLAEKHPYIRSREAQIKMALGHATDKLNVIVLEIPYVFGVFPLKKPMWVPLIKYANTSLPFLLYTDGGTAAVSVRQVAEAVATALQNPVPSGAYPLADGNFSWDKLLTHFRNGKAISVIHLKKWFLFPLAKMLELGFLLFNRESGLKASAFLTIQTNNTFILQANCMPGFMPNPTLLAEEIKLTVKNSIE